MKNAQQIIEQAWEDRANVSLKTKGNIRKAVDFALEQLDSGRHALPKNRMAAGM